MAAAVSWAVSGSVHVVVRGIWSQQQSRLLRSTGARSDSLLTVKK